MTRRSAIHVRRIYDPPEPAEGARILVDRLWPRGMSKARAALTLWLKDIAPSTELRLWFGHDPERWTEFQRRYRAELKANPAAVEQVERLGRQGPVTLVYAAHDPDHNEAVVLADYLRRLDEDAPASR
ncbi:protein of unknown function DUF488 [Gluconacetobacter diazotrophicus PA1 5]|uniref:DUF488 domain-containing protein n=1 Tax=Gluconacetobacter diazotrophicus TaxID=33996 RepID=UPI000173CEA8|nr:DUF488 domain-containing protein [Gluconacetobacter diazotrophicus]ACI51294.1 protein of unknown function DUF488 [Gluconacetobacter diazotrophicus PA1 5]TWB09842.1 uncharacterized protein YeaO (DUF488 family) [Gluconacetobacter diazotrophicus]